MPTYDGIGSSVTHEIEVVGDVFISNVEGGSLSTQVPFEIFSNVSGMVSPPTDSRQLRLRVQPTTEASPDDSYVTDMGIQNTTDNYFFITAPQNTSNVGDQNTFVISTTSNVGIGTTDPTKTLEVVGDIKCQTLSASTITGASPLTISADSISIQAPVSMPADAPMNIGTMTVSNIFHSDQLTMSANVFVTEGSTLTLSNIFHTDQLTMTSNIVMGSDKTLTTSNIVANTGENLSLNSNLFVDTATGNVGIGTDITSAPLHIYKSSNYPEVFVDYGAGGQKMSLATGTSGSVLGYSGYLVIGTITDAQLAGLSEKVRIDSSGNVGIGVASPTQKLDVAGSIKASVAFLGGTSTDSTRAFSHLSTMADGNRKYITFGNSNNTKDQAEIYFHKSANLDTNFIGLGLYGASIMHLTGAGNVGIGTTIPKSALHVTGALAYNNINVPGVELGVYASNYGAIEITNASGQSGWIDFKHTTSNSDFVERIRGGDGKLIFFTNNGERMRIDSSGSVGIGTSPFSKLTIGSTASGNGNIDELAFRSINNSAINRVGYSQRISFYCRQEYNNNNRLSAAIACIYGGNVHYPNYPGNSSTNLYFYTTNTYGTYYERFRIDSEGRIYVTGSVVHGSDDRIKINEERLTNATETLMKLDPQIYDKTSNIYSSDVVTREAGLIIQDIWYDAPELRYIIDLAEDANPPDERPLKSDNIQEDPDYSTWGSKVNHLNYTSLIPYLIKSNQEQQALIEDLRARIEALENSS
jgi:hypothetical protein